MLTTAQLATLKAAINADATAAAFPMTLDGFSDLAKYLNSVPATGQTTIWRNDLAATEIVAAIVPAELIALTTGKLEYLKFLQQPLVIDATSANVRAGFGAVFSAGATLTALTAAAQRPATRFEAIFSSGAVSTMTKREVTALEVQTARNS